MERSILYVSRPAFSLMNSEQALDGIVQHARDRNSAAGVTGALVATTNHFAQLLEGRSAHLDELMNRIEGDQRHVDVTILRVDAISKRRLPDWSMAYAGPSAYVSRQIEPLVGERLEGDPIRIERLFNLLIGLASP
jgi:hypothetical protein